MPSILLKQEGWAQRAQMVLARTAYRHADWTIAVSHAVATDLLVRYSVPRAKLSVLVNPALSEESMSETWKASSGPTARGSTQLPHRISLLVPARLVSQKRPDVAVDVVNTLAERGRDVRLVWVGDGDPSLLERAYSHRNTARIDHESWRADWWELSDDSTVVLLPSQYEGFGNVLVQAAERSIPVAACSLALGVADAVAPGITGFLASHDDAASLADAVEAAAALRSGPGTQSWLDRFSRVAATKSLLEIFDRLELGEATKEARS